LVPKIRERRERERESEEIGKKEKNKKAYFFTRDGEHDRA
jgi:hypothetical protein